MLKTSLIGVSVEEDRGRIALDERVTQPQHFLLCPRPKDFAQS
jgi:hypothetical protein